MFSSLIGLTIGLLCCKLAAGKIAIHDQMTDEELNLYFGETNHDKVAPMYDLGLLRKVKKPDNILTRVLGTGDSSDEFMFKAFGMEEKLKLKKNKLLMSRRANIAIIGEDGKADRRNVDESELNCHMLHRDENMVAAVSSCFDGHLTGFISTAKDTFEISPLTDRLKDRFRSLPPNELFEINDEALVNDLYIVKRATLPKFTTDDSQELEPWYDEDDSVLDIDFTIDSDVLDTGEAGEENKLIETAIFFDHVAYERFSRVYSNEEIESLLLAYVNQVAALYQIPSLGQKVDLHITYMEIQKTQKFDNHEGRREKLLKSFCEYSNGLNPGDDEADPRHWDVAILVSGLDLWLERNGVRNDNTLGAAWTGAMCSPAHSCAAVEFGVVPAFGKSYPTTGFSAAYTLAHEIGHTLGMNHDGDKDDCDFQGFIMSSSRKLHGQTQWSSCSKSILSSKKLKCLDDRPSTGPVWDHNNTHGVPGYFFSADEQCKFHYKGKKGAAAANEKKDLNICQSLLCTDGDEVEATGPPLEGTSCGGEGTHWCKEGKCVPVQPTRWTGWKEGVCRSGCLVHSTGFREMTRTCLVLQGYEEYSCVGEDRWIDLCEDAPTCGVRSCAQTRMTRTEAATSLCAKQAKLFPQINQRKPLGAPARHSDTKLEQACAIYCAKANGRGWFKPANNFFQDGTWCHSDGSQDYFCRDHKCLPSNTTLP